QLGRAGRERHHGQPDDEGRDAERRGQAGSATDQQLGAGRQQYQADDEQQQVNRRLLDEVMGSFSFNPNPNPNSNPNPNPNRPNPNPNPNRIRITWGGQGVTDG
ncbi:MAG TPA: hypothetical protein VK911_10965, partial [Vicinamibacterales bacterium]|nr:hypothetical protein [Vicinamibacterales bacterium]